MHTMHPTRSYFYFHKFLFDLLINKSTLGNKLYSRIININNSREMNIYIRFQHVCKIVCGAQHIIIHICHIQCIFKDDYCWGYYARYLAFSNIRWKFHWNVVVWYVLITLLLPTIQSSLMDLNAFIKPFWPPSFFNGLKIYFYAVHQS